MPWQQRVADVALELIPGTDVPVYREVTITVPRQNGKTTLMLAFEIHRALLWGASQRIAYTAQTGRDAREKLIKDQVPLLTAKGAPIKSAIDRVMRGIGNEEVIFKNGSRIMVFGSGEDAGHGKSLDLGVIDEAFADEDDRREQAMLPAMLTRPHAQMLLISTAGTERSVFLRRKVDNGRSAVAADEREGIAYFEWAAPADADPDDESVWWDCMPALGQTQRIEAVRHARKTMPDGDFRRACLNQWTVSDERVIPAAAWSSVCSVEVAPRGRLALAVDVHPDRSYASIAVADSDGNVELVKHAAGVGWCVPDLLALSRKWNASIAVDERGPAAPFIESLRAEYADVKALNTAAVTHACAAFFDAIADQKLRVRSHPDLDTAAAAVAKRQTGDAWLWGRRNASADVSPIVAATLAYAAANQGVADDDAWVLIR